MPNVADKPQKALIQRRVVGGKRADLVRKQPERRADRPEQSGNRRDQRLSCEGSPKDDERAEREGGFVAGSLELRGCRGRSSGAVRLRAWRRPRPPRSCRAQTAPSPIRRPRTGSLTRVAAADRVRFAPAAAVVANRAGRVALRNPLNSTCSSNAACAHPRSQLNAQPASPVSPLPAQP